MKFNPDLANRENARVELESRLQKEKAPEPPVKNLESHSECKITSTPESWIIPGVLYRDQVNTIELLKRPLENCAVHTQDEWTNHYNIAKPKGEFHAPDFPLLYATIKSLSTSSGKEVEEARNFIRDTARTRWLITLTRIHHNPSPSSDSITHRHGTFEPHSFCFIDMVGPDEYLKDTSRVVLYQILLGTDDGASEIDNVFNWLNGTGAYMWRLNSRPDAGTERAAGFGADSSMAYLDCNWDPQNSGSALGVRLAKNLEAKS